MFRSITLILVLAFASATSASADNDLCIQSDCTFSDAHGYDRKTVRGVEVFELEQRKYKCTCTKKIHFPTADEIARSVSAAAQKQIQQGIQEGVKNALVQIEANFAKREADLYQRLSEQEQRANAQIQLLTAMLKALAPNGAATPVPPASIAPQPAPAKK